MGEIVTKKNTAKSWLLPAYLVVLTAIGISLAVEPLREYYTALAISQNLYQEIIQLVILTVIMSICRSLPVPTRSTHAAEGVDISSVAIFASFLAKGPGATVIVLLLSAFFTFDRQEDGKLSHIFNTSILKTIFNNFNLITSMLVGYMAFSLVGGNHLPIDLGLPQILLPSILYLLVTLLADSLFMVFLYMILKGAPFLSTLLHGLRIITPTLMALSPIGYFIAFIFQIDKNNAAPTGHYMALLFFVPLLFARYAFKLYLDSKEQYLRTISTLTAAIEAKDKYTEGHSKRVAQYAVELAQMMRLRNSRIEHIKVAAVLHDIGKIGIEDEILRKPAKLTPEEWARIEQHPSIGVKILEEVDMPDAVKEMIHYHHIRFDRTGYPKVGRDKVLPIEVHIISLADAYDAMTSDRPYRGAMSEDIALDIIEQESGTQFHPEVVEAFLKMKKKK